ncbi:MAG: hypothetical protein MRERV_12c038 [Mycoplasmataceae bacterium RV_VA103A]|nr:MAG: hypothetical protein MRERV_12c038 [Mycoplasmataceae bacterium RV_VA103A]
MLIFYSLSPLSFVFESLNFSYPLNKLIKNHYIKWVLIIKEISKAIVGGIIAHTILGNLENQGLPLMIGTSIFFIILGKLLFIQKISREGKAKEVLEFVGDILFNMGIIMLVIGSVIVKNLSEKTKQIDQSTIDYRNNDNQQLDRERISY